jgi:hypothetical protein
MPRYNFETACVSFGLFLLSITGASFGQTPRFFDNAGLDPEVLFLHRKERVFYDSPFSEWDSLGQGRLQAHINYSPTLQKNSSDSATLRTTEELQMAYIALGSQACVKFGRSRKNSLYRISDSASYVADLKSQVEEFPVGILYHLLNPIQHGSQFDLLMDIHGLKLLDYTMGFRWNRPMPSLRSRGLSFEFLHTFSDIADPFHIVDLRPAGSGENVFGTFNTHYQGASMIAEIPLGDNLWTGSADYRWSRPDMAKSEYSFTDSSQSLRLGMAFTGPPPLAKIWYAYQEARVRTTGRRIPPGSSGSKRFHYALTSTSLHEMRIASTRRDFYSNSSTSMEIAGNWNSFNSTPPDEAINQHKETLSYNRLGLSFIADVYGGFARSAELVTIQGEMRQLELTPRHEQRLPWLRLELSAPMSLTWFDFSLDGESRTQELFATHVDRTYVYGRTGRILSVTPRLTVDGNLPPWGSAKLKLKAKVGQTLLLWNDITNTYPSPSAPPGGPGNGGPSVSVSPREAVYPAWANGFLGELTVALDY